MQQRLVARLQRARRRLKFKLLRSPMRMNQGKLRQRKWSRCPPNSKEQQEIQPEGHHLHSGFEIVIAPGAHHEIELTLQVRFAVYTQHFPTFEEERDELGRVAQDQADPNQPPQTRQTVSLLEVFERNKVEVPSITIRINPVRRTERLTDEGAVQRAVDAVLVQAAASPTIARAIAGNAVVPAQALADADTFRGFLRGIAAGPPSLPPLQASVDIRSTTLRDGTVRLSCYICNNTPRDLTQRFRDQHNILADCELSATVVRGELMPVELLPVAKDYQFDRRVWAVGHSASVVVSEDRKAIRTETLARFEQPRMTTNQSPRAAFSELAANPLDTLEKIRIAMIAYGGQMAIPGDRRKLAWPFSR